VRRLTLVDRIALRARWASLGPVAPLSRWGFERGTLVDRWYIEPFLDAHRAASTGGCSKSWKTSTPRDAALHPSGYCFERQPTLVKLDCFFDPIRRDALPRIFTSCSARMLRTVPLPRW